VVGATVSPLQRHYLFSACDLHVVGTLEPVEQAHLGIRLQASRRRKAPIKAARLPWIVCDLRRQTERQQVLLPRRIEPTKPIQNAA
jgi:hypothetical protein